MPDLNKQEIFAVGKWNGIEFSEEDLDDVIANFDRLNDIHHVPLKFGHNDEQEITDGQPAIGWVSKVYREGKKLLADFAHVPTVVAEAIKKKLYRNVSVEILFNVDNDGKKFNHVLDAVALLGADKPAVSGLADLEALLATRAEFSGGHRVMFKTVAGSRAGGSIKPSGDIDMPISEEDFKKLQASVDALTAKIDEKDKIIAEQASTIKASEDKESERIRKEREEKIAATRKTVKDLIDGAVRDKHMTPAIREVYTKQIGLEDDDKVLDIDVEQVKIMCNAVKSVDDKEQGKDVHTDTKYDDIKDPGQRLVKMTQDYQAEHNIKEFKEAFTFVAQANPELHQEYLDSPGEV